MAEFVKIAKILKNLTFYCFIKKKEKKNGMGIALFFDSSNFNWLLSFPMGEKIAGSLRVIDFILFQGI